MSKIGVLDSGLGGMAMMKHLVQRYPNQDFIFLADQIHSPYGHKSEDELIDIVNKNISWLKKQGASSIVFACNTISCLDPSRIDNTVYIQRIVEPTCVQLADCNYRRILVCATPFTVSSEVYQKTLCRLYPDTHVDALALPTLCSDIENMVDKNIIKEKLAKDLEPYVHQVDAVILGCTHYPVFKDLFESILECPAFDSNQITLIHLSEGSAHVQYYTTGDPSFFDQQCFLLFQMNIQSSKIEL